MQPLDGHAITNIIRSASRAARSENRDIELADIEAYVQANTAFSEYMRNLHNGFNASERAEDREWRVAEKADDAEIREDGDQHGGPSS